MTTITDKKPKDCDTTIEKTGSLGVNMGLHERALQLHYHSIKARFEANREPESKKLLALQEEITKLKSVIVSLNFELTRARDTIKAMTPSYAIVPSVHRIIDFICREEDIRKAILIGHTRSAPIVMKRHIAIYLCTQLTTLSLPQIASQFQGRDHTSILHVRRKIDNLRASDEFMNEKIKRYMGMLNGQA